jgi:hypothetical protein
MSNQGRKMCRMPVSLEPVPNGERRAREGWGGSRSGTGRPSLHGPGKLETEKVMRGAEVLRTERFAREALFQPRS